MSFWEKDYTALFISSFYRNPYMHTAGDTLNKVNSNFFVRSARELVGLMVDLAYE
jgi:hypothetical protein